ncbi:MAG: DUF411 domain-containing protein [Acidobacteria bacterium]|nr:DUF411 domain-containing protein [Acidobacteriota bacterium]
MAGFAFASAQKPAAPVVEVYKSPTCGCCSKWVDHMADAGFKVRVTDLADHELDQLKAKSGVPAQTQSCHTAIVGGYAIEGHVPATEVKRLLDEKPALAGIAVPGMPIGSPGMEVDGMKPSAYRVLGFDKAGATRVFATYDR